MKVVSFKNELEFYSLDLWSWEIIFMFTETMIHHWRSINLKKYMMNILRVFSFFDFIWVRVIIEIHW